MSPYETTAVVFSAISLVLALYSAINTYYEKHIKTKIYLRWVNQVSDQLNINLLISNMSSRPSTLTNVYLHFNDDTVESSWHNAKLIERDDKTSWSDVTPINIPARSSKNVILVFQYLNNFRLKDHITLEYKIDGINFIRTYQVKRILTGQELIIVLDHRLA